ncbi:hypothetical protein PV408_01135 [Streptomyces sp. ME18-1-4]|nr:hypothetical protein [Streptomyces sp. ME18-1-4]MDX3240466.1 hypothetical protein [Streptomyces sp. ME18-1-4]
MLLVQSPEPLDHLIAEDPSRRHRRHLNDRREHSELVAVTTIEPDEAAADHSDTRRGSLGGHRSGGKSRLQGDHGQPTECS